MSRDRGVLRECLPLQLAMIGVLIESTVSVD